MTELNWSAAAPSVSVERNAPNRVRVLRFRRPTDAVFDAIRTAAAIDLPEPGKVAVGGNGRILWIGLHEWLVIGDVSLDEPLTEVCDEAAVTHVAEVTDAAVAYAVSGRDAAALLAKGCTLDFHASQFSTVQCAQTAFAQVAVTIERPSDEQFIVYADRSFARHLDLWFEDAVMEFRSKGKIS